MTESPPLDRLLAPGFIDDVRGLGVDEIRPRLKECEQAEDSIAYRRRMLHGQLDILRAELERRAGGDASPLVERLDRILADGPSSRRGARSPLPSSTSSEGTSGMVSLTRLGQMTDAEVTAAVDRLLSAERELSADRKRLLDVIDALQAELVRAYRDATSA